MRVLIWQQFSSNHSSHFTVVGVFETPQAARYAADEIQAILDRISKWHEENPDKAEELYEKWADDGQTPSEIEIELGKQYHVRWKGGVDWFDDAQIHIAQERLVILTTEFQTDWGPEPFNNLMEYFGGQGFVTGSDIGGSLYGEIRVRVHCKAPDEATAQLIVDEKFNTWRLVFRSANWVIFEWDYEGGNLDLGVLIRYLQNLNCTEIKYGLGGKTYTETEYIAIEDEKSKGT